MAKKEDDEFLARVREKFADPADAEAFIQKAGETLRAERLKDLKGIAFARYQRIGILLEQVENNTDLPVPSERDLVTEFSK